MARIERSYLIGDDSITDEFGNTQNRITLKECKAFFKEEETRMYGKAKNIIYRVEAAKLPAEVNVTKSEFIALLKASDSRGDGYLYPNYDDEDFGVRIRVIADPERKMKTEIIYHA